MYIQYSFNNCLVANHAQSHANLLRILLEEFFFNLVVTNLIGLISTLIVFFFYNIEVQGKWQIFFNEEYF